MHIRTNTLVLLEASWYESASVAAHSWEGQPDLRILTGDNIGHVHEKNPRKSTGHDRSWLTANMKTEFKRLAQFPNELEGKGWPLTVSAARQRTRRSTAPRRLEAQASIQYDLHAHKHTQALTYSGTQDTHVCVCLFVCVCLEGEEVMCGSATACRNRCMYVCVFVCPSFRSSSPAPELGFLACKPLSQGMRDFIIEMIQKNPKRAVVCGVYNTCTFRVHAEPPRAKL